MEFSSEMHPNNEENEFRLEQLEKAINTLDNEQKQCVDLFYLKEKSYKEVSDITGFTLSQVKSYLQNGKRNLKHILINNGEIVSLLFFCIYLNR